MKNLRQLIKESLLLEKRIAQIATKIEVSFAFDVDRTHHAYLRKTRQGIEGYDEREISNGELRYVIEQVRKEIAEKITVGEIKHKEPFIIKSPEKSIAMSIVPEYQSGSYWILYITTVFRESYDNPFRTGEDQLIIWA